MAGTLSAGDDTVAEAVARVGGMLESIFTTVQETCEQATDLLVRLRAHGRRPGTADLARLQPLLRRQLQRGGPDGLVSGTGFIAEPGLLADVPAWLEWWQTRADGKIQPMLLDLDPATSAYSDYTHWDWFALPRTTGRRAVSGPYVDYLCSDEYSLTLAVPVYLEREQGAQGEQGERRAPDEHGPGAPEFAGVAAADVYLRHFEAAVGPALRRVDGPAYLVNPRGRVAASNTANRLVGSLVKDIDAASARGELVLHPCGAIPLTLVTAA